MFTQVPSEPATDGSLLIPVRKLKETQRNGRSFERLVVYYAISTTFTRTLDVIYLRCYFVWGLAPDLHVVPLIFSHQQEMIPVLQKRKQKPREIRKISPGPADPKG